MILKKRFLVLKEIVENNSIASKIGKNTKMSSNSISMILSLFEKVGLIKRKSFGRFKKILITKKGLRVFKNLKEIDDLWK